MTNIDLAFSPCPNDTFMFHALLYGCIDTGGLIFQPHIYDVETLNREAENQRFQVTKLSFFAYLTLKEHYHLLDAGAALGFGCGPLLVAKSADVELSKARVAIPGRFTTAHLLLKLRYPELSNVVETRFDNILPGIEAGEFDAGAIIHEGRFIYPNYKCVKIIDLGEWWEKETGLPIPLGCIVARKDEFTTPLHGKIEGLLRRSIEFAFSRRDASRDFIKIHAQEMDDAVIDAHINLYVNEFSLSLGEKGRKAVATLEEMARCRKIL
ncbi:MAG: 1,4-dihydroxy-6-naphthoate synthase [Deltaproteobacteria bacterium]|nr:1,4-dihydroxy-6-naphthoate synthase [Deltaproteobacteria bacterium]